MANTKKATKKMSKKEIMKQLRDPKTSKAKKDKLMEQLYEGIDIK